MGDLARRQRLDRRLGGDLRRPRPAASGQDHATDRRLGGARQVGGAERRARGGRGRAFLFVDSDDTVPPDWLAAMAAALGSHDFVAAYFDVSVHNQGWVRTYRERGRQGARAAPADPSALLPDRRRRGDGLHPPPLRGRGRLRHHLRGAGGPRLLHPRAPRGLRAASGARDALQLPLPGGFRRDLPPGLHLRALSGAPAQALCAGAAALAPSPGSI